MNTRVVVTFTLIIKLWFFSKQPLHFFNVLRSPDGTVVMKHLWPGVVKHTLFIQPHTQKCSLSFNPPLFER